MTLIFLNNINSILPVKLVKLEDTLYRYLEFGIFPDKKLHSQFWNMAQELQL